MMMFARTVARAWRPHCKEEQQVMPQKLGYLGIDVSKAHLDVARAGEAVERCANTPEGIAALIGRLREDPPDLTVLEATGGYEMMTVRALQEAGLAVAVVNPRQVRDFARASGRLAKTDAIDARMLAAFAAALPPKPLPAVDASQSAIGALVTRRRQIIDMLIAERNRLEHATASLRGWIEDHMTVLKSQLAQIDAAITLAVEANPALRRRFAILTSVKGVGLVTAAVLLAELPELGTIGHKQVAALVGVAPINRDSGQYRGQRHIGGGRPSVRCALYMATIVAARFNPTIQTFYRRLKGAGKKPKVAIVAAMRKLITILNALLRDDQLWQPNTSLQQDGC
jgi:transposase